MVTKELIERFFRNECTAEEQLQVLEYFKINPDEFEQYLDEKEWEHFEARENMDPVLSKKRFENVRRQTIQKRTRVQMFWRVAIAASILLAIGFSWIFLSDDEQRTISTASQTMKADSVSFAVRHESNTSGKDKRIVLADGSVIVLANNSEITYQEPFTSSRDITLIGKAYFKVAKDKNKVFKVISGALSTTALGTEFTVTAIKRTNQVIVRLYEGKVVVKAVDKTNTRIKKGLLLLPGQEFIYGNQTTAKVVIFKVKNIAPEQIMKEERMGDSPSIPENAEAPFFMFNNQSLSMVFDDLSALYNVKIFYDRKDVQNIYFTGKYDRSESLKIILTRLAMLNKLTVNKNDTAFIISK